MLKESGSFFFFSCRFKVLQVVTVAMLGLLLADECNRKNVYMFIWRYVAKTQPRSIRLTCQQRCVSRESNNVTLFTATTRRGRVSALCPSLSQLPLCLSLCILPLPFSVSAFFSASTALWCSSRLTGVTCTHGPISPSNTLQSAHYA